MSNIYIQEPPATGKVLLKTSGGDIDIELWTKEAPKACRNFIQLCLEGYYNDTIFHRVVPNFIVQGGDPNGDGTGGESVYGGPFKDEFHSRLRFNRRGLVACANAGKDDNGSQFFFTLAATPELQNKHTIFGKVTGETIFNMLKLAEGELDIDDKPLYPKKILSTEVQVNPFTDITPRKLANDKGLHETKIDSKKSEKTGVKNFGLLSFGEEAEEDEEDTTAFRGKPKSTHDLLDDPKLSKQTSDDIEPEAAVARSKEDEELTKATVSNIRDKLKIKNKLQEPKEEAKGDEDSEEEYYLGKDRIEARKKQAEEIRSQIKDLKREMAGKKKKDNEEGMEKDKNSKGEGLSSNELLKQFEEEQDKYRKINEKLPKKGTSRKCYEGIERKPWVKNLYENKDYPDNYTDVKFLEQMKRNVNQQTVTFFECFLGSCRVTQKLSTCVLFAVLFTYLYNDWVSTQVVFSFSCIITILGYVLYLVIDYSLFIVNKSSKTHGDSGEMNLKTFKKFKTKTKDKNSVVKSSLLMEEAMIDNILEKNMKWYLKSKAKKEDSLRNVSNKDKTKCKIANDKKVSYQIFVDLKTVLIYLVFGYIVSPILHTLTDTVSTDTIFATTSIMMLIHLIFSDYGVSVALVSNSLSINAAIFGSICLASRLSTSFHAFVLITVAVQCFFLFPILIKYILQYRFALVVLLFTIFSAFVSLWFISKTIFYIFLVTVLFLNVYCPFLFVRWQRHKDNIYGPWDEAVVYDSDNVDQCIGREEFTLSLLKKFQNKLSSVKEKALETKDDEEKQGGKSADDNEDVEDDNWLAHELHFEDKGAVLAKDASTKGDDWFDIYDPRNPLNKRKREQSKNVLQNKLKKKD